MLSVLSSQLSAQALNLEPSETLNLSSWMAQIPDSRMVCKISIPGTHDSATAEGFIDESNTNDYTTQVARIKTQLNGGIRYFDLRLVFKTTKGKSPDTLSVDTVLQLAHRTAAIKLSYKDVLSQISTFLKENPSEFVIIKIQYDGGTLTPEEQQTWNRLIGETTGLTSPIAHNFRADLTLGEVRGLILMFSRTNYGEPISGAMTNWLDEGTDDYKYANLLEECSHWLKSDSDSAHFYVQDYYNSIGTRMPAKLHAIEAMYNRSQQIDEDDPIWILTHTSAFSSPKMNAIGYATNASKTNKKFIQFLSRKDDTRPVGIVAMDFSCIDYLNTKIGTLGTIKRSVKSKTLTRKIIERNFITPKKQ